MINDQPNRLADELERVASAVAAALYGPDFDPFENPEGWERAEYIATAASAALRSPVLGDDVERVARAIEAAQCNGREGPFGGYDYGHNEAFYGPAPEQGRYVIRDFRDSASADYGKPVHYSHDRDEHERMFKQMTEHHIARAAIAALSRQSVDHDGLVERLRETASVATREIDIFERPSAKTSSDLRNLAIEAADLIEKLSRWDTNRSFNGGIGRVAQPDAWTHESHGGELHLDGSVLTHWMPRPDGPSEDITPHSNPGDKA